jgi:hypothetical protein
MRGKRAVLKKRAVPVLVLDNPFFDFDKTDEYFKIPSQVNICSLAGE